MKWRPFRSFVRRPIVTTRLTLEQLESRLLPSVDVLQYHGDISSSGVNSNETQLTPTSVSSGAFNKLFNTPVDGQVYAQPLVDTGVVIASGAYTTPGSAGVHNVVFVATENDTVYAIDADPGSTGQVLWQRNFLDPNNPNDALSGATSLTAIPSVDVNYPGSQTLTPEVGITDTPVIDPSTNTMYLVTSTKQIVNGTARYVQTLHGINITNGTDVTAPYVVGDTTYDASNNTSPYVNNTSIYVYGNGDGSVTDPYNGTGQPVVQFNAMRQFERVGLNLVNGVLYTAWASHDDQTPYHGWIATWNVSNIASKGFQLSGVLNTTPGNDQASIWQSGGSLSFEPDGSAFYFDDGNGDAAVPPTLDANGFPVGGNYPEAVAKVVLDPTTSPTNQNVNGWGMQIVDYFMPYDTGNLDNTNGDLSSGPLVLPASAGIPGHSDLLVVGGKSGKIYVLDRNNLGHYNPNNDNVVNAVPNGRGNNTPPVELTSLVSTPVFFNGELYVVGGYSDYAKAYSINSDGTLSLDSQTANTFGFEPSSPTISANGTSNGIVWLINRSNNELTAYDASNLADQLWNSGVGGANSLDSSIKFSVPTVANGMVFVGTQHGLTVYGLTQAVAAPQTPTLSASTLSGTSINLTWTDPSTRPNVASAYVIEQSTDGVHFAPVTTAAQGTTSLAIGGLSPGVEYWFRAYGLDSIGHSPYSNVVSIIPSSLSPTLNYSGGFANSGASLTYNGSAAISGGAAELSDGGTYEANSVFTKNPVNVTAFQTQFTFQLSAGSSTADGFTFTIQGVGPTAVGTYGGGLGYGPDTEGSSGGIAHSLAIKFDLYDNEGEGSDSTGLYVDGAAPTNLGSIDLSNTGIDLHSGDVFQVNVNYAGDTLAVTIRDTKTGASATQTYSINVPATVGGNSAYVGFTAGTGGDSAVQKILSWTYSSGGANAPAAPTGLIASPVSANTIALYWNNNADNAEGYYLDRATDPNFTQNLVTQTLPTGSSFLDTDGLQSGNVYFYRLRSFNVAGSSVNTPFVGVVFQPPPAPSNPIVSHDAWNTVTLNWTDNAGASASGYEVFRSADGAPFALLATLPSGSRSWSDAGVSGHTFYEYRVVAFNTVGSNGFADFLVSTPAAPASSPSPAAVSAAAFSSNLLQELFQLEIEAFLLSSYSALASSSGNSSFTAQIYSLLADIQSSPLYNTSFGNYAIGQGAALAQPANAKKQ